MFDAFVTLTYLLQRELTESGHFPFFPQKYSTRLNQTGISLSPFIRIFLKMEQEEVKEGIGEGSYGVAVAGLELERLRFVEHRVLL